MVHNLNQTRPVLAADPASFWPTHSASAHQTHTHTHTHTHGEMRAKLFRATDTCQTLAYVVDCAHQVLRCSCYFFEAMV